MLNPFRNIKAAIRVGLLRFTNWSKRPQPPLKRPTAVSPIPSDNSSYIPMDVTALRGIYDEFVSSGDMLYVPELWDCDDIAISTANAIRRLGLKHRVIYLAGLEFGVTNDGNPHAWCVVDVGDGPVAFQPDVLGTFESSFEVGNTPTLFSLH